MKRILILCLILLFAIPLHAAQGDKWCQWNDIKTYNCQIEDSRGWIKGNAHWISGPENFGENGFLRTHEPTEIALEKNEKVVGVIETKTGSEIFKTYVVVQQTDKEQKEATAAIMSDEIFLLLKWLTTAGAIDTTTGKIDQSTAPKIIKEAFIARKALGQ